MIYLCFSKIKGVQNHLTLPWISTQKYFQVSVCKVTKYGKVQKVWIHFQGTQKQAGGNWSKWKTWAWSKNNQEFMKSSRSLGIKIRGNRAENVWSKIIIHKAKNQASKIQANLERSKDLETKSFIDKSWQSSIWTQTHKVRPSWVCVREIILFLFNLRSANGCMCICVFQRLFTLEKDRYGEKVCMLSFFLVNPGLKVCKLVWECVNTCT